MMHSQSSIKKISVRHAELITSMNLLKGTVDISTSNHIFKREIWDKFTEFFYLKFRNLSSETR